MVKKIFKLTTVSFLGPFIVTFFVVLFTIVMQFLWKYIDDLVGKGLEWYIIGELLFYATASFVPLAIPLAILLSSIMSFGKLAETYELVALKSAGVSLFRIMFPQVVLITFIAIGSFFFSNNVIPRANLKFHSLLWDVRQQRPALDIREGVFYGGIDNYVIRINKKHDDERTIEDITIYDHTGPTGNHTVLTARSGEMYTTADERWLIMKLFDGHRYEEMQTQDMGTRTYPANRMSFKSYEMRLDLSVFNLSRTREELFKDNYQMLSVGQLAYYADSMIGVVEIKRQESTQFSKPYFSFLNDSSIITDDLNNPPDTIASDSTAAITDSVLAANAPATKKDTSITPDTVKAKAYVDTLPATASIIEAFPKDMQAKLAQRAKNSVRTVSDVLRVQGEDLGNWVKLQISYVFEWHRKFSLAVACLTFLFIGAPLGAIIRKGGIGMPTVVSIVLFIVFYVISIAAEQSAKEQAISVFMGAWIANIILFPIGLYLTWRANVDAISFNFDWASSLRRRFSKKRIPR